MALPPAPPSQVNKNVLLKARAGSDAVCAALALKTWWAPSLTLSATGGWDLHRRRPLLGLQVVMENFGNLRCGCACGC